tara:strand:- start:11 stop:661 length:651 start_codon:yes stop_codon:yes gene_type:complete
VFYVYHLIDPRDNTVFYVGKGKGDRCNVHTRPSELEGNTSHKANKIRKIHSEGLEPIVKIVESNLTEDVSFERERFYISNIQNLTNMTDGGEGPSGRVPWNKGKKMSKEARKNMSISRKKSKAFQDHKNKMLKKMIEVNTGKKRPEHAKHMQTNNSTYKAVENETKLLWANKKTNQEVFGNRHQVKDVDNNVSIKELGCVIKGLYKSHKGWFIKSQ